MLSRDFFACIEGASGILEQVDINKNLLYKETNQQMAKAWVKGSDSEVNAAVWGVVNGHFEERKAFLDNLWTAMEDIMKMPGS
jgi:hypothetical protein